MKYHTKSILYGCFTAFTLICMACSGKNADARACSVGAHSQQDAKVSKPRVTHVVLDTKAKEALLKKQVHAVYCVAKGVS